jgi:3'-5' exoribonuclease
MMASAQSTIIHLWDLADKQAAQCFAILAKREKLKTKKGDPYIKCFFRAKHDIRAAMIWMDHKLYKAAESWELFSGYRLNVIGDDTSYGKQLIIEQIRPAEPADEADGYNYNDLLESSDFSSEDQFRDVLALVDRYVDDTNIKKLVITILNENKELLKKMPAAQKIHHTYTGGLLEHIWSLTIVCGLLADHYAKYYHELNPPLNKSLLVAAAVLHDLGKLRELEYHPVEASYTKEGNLVGHVVLGRDLVRDAARKMPGFPEETLLLLEHAILAHHGKEEFGAPKAPRTLEALLVHYADEIDSKVNAVVHELRNPANVEMFSNKVYAVGNRQFYKGIPTEPSSNDINERR